jgi:hypothetical protein
VDLRGDRLGRLLPRLSQVAARREGAVDRDPPDPGLQAALAAKSPPVAERTGERVLHDLARRLEAAGDSSDAVPKNGEAGAVQLFQLGNGRGHPTYRS